MKNLIWLLMVPALLAQQPKIQNARLETRPAGAGLDQVFRSLMGAQTAPAWIGYAVPIVAGEHHMCCSSSSNCCGCSLEGSRGTSVSSGPVQLEGSKWLAVLYRVEQRNVDKVRAFSGDCELDAGGLPFYWLTDARPAESVALLSSLVSADRRRMNGVLAAVAMHADPAADRALDDFVNSSRPEEVRRQAAFWMGSARGRSGFERLRRLLREDSSQRVREHVIFALTQSKEPEATSTIIQAAREDKDSHVRGQALFWLAQKATRQIAATAIAEAIDKDPETEVKKRAVFALTQIPGGEGVPKLIEVARTNHNPAVRKQAMFWLGQSKDPRALRFFEEVLAK